MDEEDRGHRGRMSDEPPEDENRHQRDSGAALLLGGVVLAVLMVGYVYLH